MSDLGPLYQFLGVEVTKKHGDFFLSQTTYSNDILNWANMSDWKSCTTPANTDSKLSATGGQPFVDGTLYYSVFGALQYLTFTRWHIAYAVKQVCLFKHAPHGIHFSFLKRILHYLKGTLDLGFTILPSKSATITTYLDADWGGRPESRRSTLFCNIMIF